MSYLNSEQEEYCKYLASVPLNKKCYCGWFLDGECHTCPKGRTCEEKMAKRCSVCNNYPSLDGRMTHSIKCSLRT